MKGTIERYLNGYANDSDRCQIEIEIDNDRLSELKLMCDVDESYDKNMFASYEVSFSTAQTIASWKGKTIPSHLDYFVEAYFHQGLS